MAGGETRNEKGLKKRSSVEEEIEDYEAEGFEK